MANNYQARLKAIEAALKAKLFEGVSKAEKQRVEALKSELEAMSDEEVVTRFQEMLNRPLSPELQAKLDDLKGLSEHEVINKYIQFIRESK